MKIAIIGDMHLGFDHHGPRKNDSFINAREAFDIAISEKVDLIIQTGDLFHERLPKPEVLSPAIQLMNSVKSKLNSPKIINRIYDGKEELLNKEIPPIVLIYGNHEKRPPEYINPLQMLHGAGSVYLMEQESLVIEAGKERIGIHGLSSVSETYVKELVKDWNPKAFPNMKNLLLIHQNFQELLPKQPPETMSYSDLPSNMDYHILGHIHWAQTEKHPKSKAPIVLPGSTVMTDLKWIESKSKKGILIVDFKERISSKFVELKNSRILHYEVINAKGKKPSDITNEIQEDIIKKIEYHNHKLIPLLRYSIRGELADGFIPSDVSLRPLVKKYIDRVLIKIDKSKLTSKILSEKAKLVSDLKQNKVSVEALGIKILSEKMKIKDLDKLSFLFNALGDGDLEAAEKLL
ncbi:DNA repair exonuclease [Candidatus Woesearchaeota archaeon]|jgi:DNA repair exonuclease SbcCD nuclease subunit|nr:DNA repair exonuclease [Candidatus Woesearchaeota archaeon]MBT6023498.1 DNA repair exonuclease [Candidatus Woesearchaeota archaeon]